MPVFENCPEEAERYRRDYVECWKDVVSYTYEAMVKSIGAITDARKIVPILEGLKEIKPPMKFDDKNDDNMAKRHAFYSSVDAVKKYLKEEVEKNGHVPPINNVLLNVKAEPRYASFSFG